MVVQEHFGKVTDTALADLRGRLGQDMTSRDTPYLTEVTRDAIRHWAQGTGDRNRLYLDEAYAKQTRWGGLIAPPTMLFAFNKLSIGYRGGLPGIHSFFGGVDWQFHRPLKLGDRPKVRVVFSDLVEMPSRFAGRMFKQISEVTYTNQAGETIAVAYPYGFRTERSTAADRGKYEALEPAKYTPEDIAGIAAEYRREEIRGAEPRYWQDVQVGDELSNIVRGPQTVTNAIAFYRGYGGWFIMSHGNWYDYLDRHPAAGIPNDHGVPEPPARAHWDSTLAKKVGVPAAYDYGPERVTWFASLCSNWMGDDGFLKRLYVEVRRFNLLGDTTHCYGRVVDKRQEGDEYLVDIDLWSKDQRGEQSCQGSATVGLPSR